jgi:serine/threonine protein kinase
VNIGETIQEQYQIEDVLGHGNMGTTYKAIDLQTEDPVAVKRLQRLDERRLW